MSTNSSLTTFSTSSIDLELSSDEEYLYMYLYSQIEYICSYLLGEQHMCVALWSSEGRSLDCLMEIAIGFIVNQLSLNAK
jgi:hypothetical protein